MGIKKIPEQVITTCDDCGLVKSKDTSSKFLLGGTIVYKCNGLDYQGATVGIGDNDVLILCDSCYIRVKSAIMLSVGRKSVLPDNPGGAY